MKTTVLFIVTFFAGTLCFAQYSAGVAFQKVGITQLKNTQHSFNSNSFIPDKRLKSEQHYKNLRTMGIITTAAGVAFEVIGVNMVYHHMALIGGGSNATTNWGIGGMFGGALATAGGITMWVMGHRRLKKVRNMSVEQTKNGIGLVYKF